MNDSGSKILVSPADLEIGVAARELLERADEAQARLMEHGEFDDEIRAEIARTSIPLHLQNSFAIEGINLDPQPTRTRMEIDVAQRPPSDNDDDVDRALRTVARVDEFARTTEPLSVDWILSLHRTLFPFGGEIRDHDVYMGGASKMVPPGWESVHDELNWLVSQYNAAEAGHDIHHTALAAWLHHGFVRIHPFFDGNGRIARFLQDFVLIRHDRFPVGIPAARKHDYYQALAEADDASFDSLVELVASAEISSTQLADSAVEEVRSRRDARTKLISAVKRNVRNSDHALYRIWSERADRFLASVTADAEEIRRELRDSDWFISIYRYEDLPYETWSELSRSRTGRARNTWMLNIRLKQFGRSIYDVVFYARQHNFNLAADEVDVPKGQVGLFVTGQEPSTKYDFDRYSDPTIALREVLFLGDDTVAYEDPAAARKREGDDLDPALADTELWLPRTGRTIGEISLSFIEDLLTKGGLTG